MFIIRSLLITAACAFMVSCGNLPVGTPNAKLTFQGHPSHQTRKTYHKVVVKDFTGRGGLELRSHFADSIADAIRSARPKASVVRNAIPDAETLLISGKITRYKNKWAALDMGYTMCASDGGTGKTIASTTCKWRSSCFHEPKSEAGLNWSTRMEARYIAPLVR
ncbi:MAG: hypothetical protein U0984_14860 [Prosthecobacter sp.]|nr:hypothetical protein [Prosthecobacter sp.]